MARSSDAVFPLSLFRDRTFQMRQIRRVMWLALFFIVQSTLLLGVFYHNLLGDVVAGTAPLLFASEDLELLNSQIPDVQSVMLKWLVVMLAINALVMVFVGLFILRKLGSPLLAIRRALEEIGEGNLHVRLRKNDTQEFSELCEALDHAVEQIHVRIEQVRDETRVLTLMEQQPPPSQKTIEQALLNCQNVLSFFTDEDVRAGSSGEAANNLRGPRKL